MENGGLTIRQLGAEDVDIFRRIRLESLELDPAAYASSYEDWAPLSVEGWRQNLQNPVFVAFRDGEPVGIMGLLPQRARKMAHRATIIMVYVRRSERGTGLARSLLDSVTAHARETGILQLELSVSAENPAAIRFYQREGFHDVGRIPGGFRHERREIDDIVMVRRLPELPVR